MPDNRAQGRGGQLGRAGCRPSAGATDSPGGGDGSAGREPAPEGFASSFGRASGLFPGGT